MAPPAAGTGGEVVVAAALPPLTGYRALLTWQPAPLADAVLGVLAAGYLIAVAAVRRRHPGGPWPATRAAAYLTGLATIAISLQSGIAVYDGTLFSAHMVQHVLLIMVAPPLLVYGRPVTVALHAARNPVHSWVKRAVRSRAATALTRPAVATAGYAAAVAGTHTPPVMDLVVRNEIAHDAEHIAYLVSGYLFFLVVIGSEPLRRRVPLMGRFIMLLVAMQVDTVVGVVFMVAGHELFGVYGHGPAALTDLHDGGMVMWIGSDIVMTILAVALAVALVHAPRRRAAPAHPGGSGESGEEARLAAYNSYLASLAQTSEGPAGAAGG